MPPHKTVVKKAPVKKPAATAKSVKEIVTSTPVNLVKKVDVAVNPRHYKEYLPGMQWFESIQYDYDAEGFFTAVHMQIRKYLDRMGKKDECFQEYSKTAWYLKYLFVYVCNEGPVSVETVNRAYRQLVDDKLPTSFNNAIRGYHAGNPPYNWIEAQMYRQTPEGFINIMDSHVRENLEMALHATAMRETFLAIAVVYMRYLLAFMANGNKPFPLGNFNKLLGE